MIRLQCVWTQNGEDGVDKRASSLRVERSRLNADRFDWFVFGIAVVGATDLTEPTTLATAGSGAGALLQSVTSMSMLRKAVTCCPYVQVLWNGWEIGCTDARHGTTSPTWRSKVPFIFHHYRLKRASATSDMSPEEKHLSDLRNCSLSFYVWDSSKLVDKAKDFSSSKSRAQENVSAFLGCK